MKKKAPKKHWQIFLDKYGNKCKRPFCEASKKAIEKYKVNQLVHGTIVGETDERSPEQLRLYWLACNFTSERVDDIDWSTREHVDYQVKMSLKFFDLDFIFYNEVTKQLTFKLLSISYENMEHIDACNFMPRAFEVMANKIPREGFYLVDDFIKDVMASAKGSRINKK